MDLSARLEGPDRPDRPAGPRRRPGGARRRVLAAATACLAGVGGLVAAGPGAQAAPEAAAAPDVSSCLDGQRAPGAGVVTRELTASSTGLVRARLGGTGDWDLAVFDRASGTRVAASAGFGGRELAEGFVRAGQRLVVQACGFGGPASTAAGSPTIRTQVLATPTGASGTSSLVEVRTPTRREEERLQALGLDLTEHGTPGTLEIVAHGPRDLERLTSAGLRYRVTVPDLEARAAASRAEDQSYAATTARSPLPSGRTTYRRLADYELEMKRLARRYPGMVRPFTLRYRTVEGRDVHGIEIARGADQIADGKPAFLLMGLHHAREWPSGEHAMEFAYDLLQTYRTSARTKRLVDRTRTIVVPVVNPDGFTISREAPRLGDFSLFDYENKRKNCAVAPAPPRYRGGTCVDNPAGRLRGTDLNRNYAGFWGGPGASAVWSDDTFRGPAPFSEPETQNIRDLVSNRQITNLISNHTYSNLILRPPGQYDTQTPKDEPLYRALGRRMADRNGYSNDLSYELYQTTGTTEDWSFWSTGGLGFTFEIGDEGFHPAFRRAVVGEYLGRAPAEGAGRGGNRAAYYEMLASTADPDLHSTLTGTAPAGHTLRVHKGFTTPTSPVVAADGTVGRPRFVRDVLDSTYASDGGRFSWAVNPSTRPYVDGRLGREAVAPPQATIRLRNPAGIPAENTGDPLEGPHESIPFTVAGLPEADNGRLTVHVEWESTDTDWDLYVYDADGQVVASSAAGGTNREDALLLDPEAGDYTAVLVNYAGGAQDDWSVGRAIFQSPLPAVEGRTESWLLSCEGPGGTLVRAVRIVVDRGETLDLGAVCRKRS